jgi:phage/plasmid-like protein (TIGR03299 family)
MFAISSVREKPWSGIGDMLENSITVEEARVKYLTWHVSKVPISAELSNNNGTIVYKRIPDRFALLRCDNQDVLGSCTNKYQIYQNDDMWDMLSVHITKSGMTIENIGSIKGGKYTWVLLKGDTFEIVAGDPIESFLLFRNSFTGIVSLSTLFINIRKFSSSVIAINFGTIKNMHNVRHSGNMFTRVVEVEKVINAQKVYQQKTKEALQYLIKKIINKSTIVILLDKIFAEYSYINRNRKIQQVLALMGSGVGTSMIDVNGTAYGLFLAFIEWVDHGKMVTDSIHSTSPIKFENVMFISTDIKTKMLDILLKYI